MKLDYKREQTITRFKDYQKVETIPFTTEGSINVDKENLYQVANEIMEAAKADHYDLTRVSFTFSKSNKRRKKVQEIRVYNW